MRFNVPVRRIWWGIGGFVLFVTADGRFTDVISPRHSTGRNLIEQGGVRKWLGEAGFDFFDLLANRIIGPLFADFIVEVVRIYQAWLEEEVLAP